MKRTFDASRRRFLATASALSAVGPTVAPFALNLAAVGSAAAQGTCVSDYKALVCIYLAGGNDSFNMVLPTDHDSFGKYETARKFTLDSRSPSILIEREGDYSAIALSSGVDQQVSTRKVALHPEMTHAKELFDAHRLAIVPNVGPLTETIRDIADYNKLASERKLPVRLFSHSDQTSAWQAFGSEGTVRGWGGRLGDLFASCNGERSNFTSISATGNVMFLAGDTTMQYQVTSAGAVSFPVRDPGLYGATGGGAALRRIATRRTDHLILREQAKSTQRSIDLGGALNGLITGNGVEKAPRWETVKPGDTTNNAPNSLCDQLGIVARIIDGARKSNIIKRQVFMVQLAGFDTHTLQALAHARLMGQLSQALGYFDNLLAPAKFNARDAVTVFTASEFGRTFGSNGHGTDHGWGAHHLVRGGAVDGGKVHGVIPVMGLNAPRTVARGSMIPAISVDQYAGHLARWFGANNSDLATLFPNLSRFSASASPSFFKA
jgi:uncharacterized protein (DUF1501 family)